MRSPTPTDSTLTSRQERFCQAFVVYATASTAAIEAGYARSNARQYGSRLLKTERIRARIKQIQSALAADHGRDLDVLLGKLEIVYRRAIEDHHFTAAARAVELQAKLGRMAKLPVLSLSGPLGVQGPSSPLDLSLSGPLNERGPSSPLDLSLSGPLNERGPSSPLPIINAKAEPASPISPPISPGAAPEEKPHAGIKVAGIKVAGMVTKACISRQKPTFRWDFP